MFILSIFNKKILNINSLNNLTNYIMQYKKNLLTSSIIKKILNETSIKNNIYDKFKLFIIENLMINYSINNSNKIKEILIYFNIIINNNRIISNNYLID